MNIGLKEFHSFLHEGERLKRKKTHILDNLNNKNIANFSFYEKGKNYDLIANIILTGGVERDFLREIGNTKEPILIFFDYTDNSLAATLEIKTKLEDMGRKTLIVSIDEDSKKLGNITKTLLVKGEIKGTKMGSFGIPSPWLIASIPDRDAVMQKLGIEIVDIELQEIYNEVRNVSKEEIESIVDEFIKGAKGVSEPKREDIEDAVKIYIAIKKLVKKYNLSSLTLSCFTILEVLKNTGCFALSMLNDEGIIAGCEGDIESTLTMFLLYKLTGEVPFMANPSGIDRAENSITLAHCTIARKILKNYIIRSHFESGIGVGIQGELKTDKVTIFRLGGKNLEKSVLYTGNLLPHTHSENLCRTQIKVKLNEDVSQILENPAGNHLIVIGGHHKEIVKTFLDIL